MGFRERKPENMAQREGGGGQVKNMVFLGGTQNIT